MLEELLSPAAAELYERLVDGEYIRIAADVGTDPECVGSPAHELAELGLVKHLPVDPDRLLPVEPAGGLLSGVQPLWQRVTANLQTVSAAVRDMESLQRRFIAAGADIAASSSAALLTVKEQIPVRHAAMTDRARKEILAFALNTRLTRNPQSLVVPREAQVLQGIVARTVFSADHIPEMEHLMIGSVEGGELVRVAAGLPIKMKIVDGQEAIVGIDDTGLRAALYVREPALIAALQLLFESVWERAVPYPAATTDDAGLTTREREVLVLLATGDKDETIAKKLDLGVRTVRRHISTAMQKLGTESRFAAGVQAVKRGWL